ncbi:MAG: hypothetical protein K5872_15500 [Rhizobiaceae bacterium]|nr:hypothetical protein [Rhizobiaceae bacterium]
MAPAPDPDGDWRPKVRLPAAGFAAEAGVSEPEAAESGFFDASDLGEALSSLPGDVEGRPDGAEVDLLSAEGEAVVPDGVASAGFDAPEDAEALPEAEAPFAVGSALAACDRAGSRTTSFSSRSMVTGSFLDFECRIFGGFTMAGSGSQER